MFTDVYSGLVAVVFTDVYDVGGAQDCGLRDHCYSSCCCCLDGGGGGGDEDD